MSSTIASTGLALISLQLLSRGLTFILNQCLVRLTTPEVLGIATIQFEVVLNTTLFLAREGVRGALVRTFPQAFNVSNDDGTENDKQWKRRQQLINAAFLPIPLGCATCVLVYGVFLYSLSPSVASQSHFNVAVCGYGIATCIELLAEPFYIVTLAKGETSARVKWEGRAVVVKTIATLGTVLMLGHEWALVAFAVGQVAFSVVILYGFWNHVGSTIWPSRSSQQEAWLSRQDVDLVTALTRQSLVKQFLTEGDKIMIGRLCPIKDQGGYAIALNYGSLVARIIFQPVEETARLHFSSKLGMNRVDGRRESLKEEQARYNAAAALLSSLLFVHAHFGLIVVAFGPPYVRSLLTLVLGPSSRFLQTSAAATLQTYCYLLPLLGVNGVIEAFVQAVATEGELDAMARMMVVWSGAFVAAAAVGSRVVARPEAAMMAATAVNMSCRIGWGAAFVRRYFALRATPCNVLDGAWPGWGAVTLSVAMGVLVRSGGVVAESTMSAAAVHVGPGAMAGVVSVAALLVGRRRRWRQVWTSVRGR